MSNKYTFQAYAENVDKTNKNLHKNEFNVEFDIQWVNSNQHWLPNVTKILPNENFDSRVNYGNKTIHLANIDIYRRISGRINQNTFKHEFGHTIKIGDEYSKVFGNPRLSAYVNDTKSLMNIGNELRRLYISDVLKKTPLFLMFIF